MNVLSLFDGISCGRIALERAGIPVENYFASEIDKFAMQVSRVNWPGIQQVGDVCGVHAADFPKIDLLIGGSPCQGFSFAGKGLNFNDPRSALFFEYVRILNEIRKTNPDVIFLLENVPMKREHQMVISKYLGVEPIEINGALVSAQNRKRLFWTNIKARPFNLFGDLVSIIPQPKDKGVLLRDILQPVEDVDKKYYLSKSALSRLERRMNGKFSKPCINTEKSGTATTRSNSGRMNLDGGTTLIKVDIGGNISPNQDKSGCFTAGGNSAGNHSDMDLIFIEQTPRGNNNGGQRALNWKTPSVTANRWEQNNHVATFAIRGRDKEGGGTEQVLEVGGEKANSVTLSNKASMVFINENGGAYHQQDRLNFENGKARSVPAGSNGNASHHTNTETNGQYRRLAPIEVERLFTLPENYTSAVSDSQRYRCMGNGWVVDVIAHIFSHIEK